MPGVRGGVDVGEGLGADPAAGPAVRRRVRAGAVAQAALAVPHRGLSAAVVHRAGRPGAGRDAHDDSAAGGARGGGRGRPGPVRGRCRARGVVADGAARGRRARRGRAGRARSRSTVLGMDETRFGRPRWLPDGEHDDGRMRWRRTDPWETGFVDITGEQALLGQVDGRTSAAVQAWLAARSRGFRAGVEVVVIDPHAGYAAAVRAALPDARVAVDHFHLIMLANKAVTAVRQRVTRDLLGRRGRKIDPTWANRRLLLRGRERLSPAALARMWNGCVDHDPTGQILSAWIAKEELRALCATAARGGHRRRDPRPALGVLPVVRRRADPRADHARGDDRDLVAGDRGVPDDRADERPDRGHEPVDQAGETRRLRLPEPGELPAPGTVALHPAHPPIVSEEPDGARLKSKSPICTTLENGRRGPQTLFTDLRSRTTRRSRVEGCTVRFADLGLVVAALLAVVWLVGLGSRAAAVLSSACSSRSTAASRAAAVWRSAVAKASRPRGGQSRAGVGIAPAQRSDHSRGRRRRPAARSSAPHPASRSSRTGGPSARAPPPWRPPAPPGCPPRPTSPWCRR